MKEFTGFIQPNSFYKLTFSVLLATSLAACGGGGDFAPADDTTSGDTGGDTSGTNTLVTKDNYTDVGSLAYGAAESVTLVSSSVQLQPSTILAASARATTVENCNISGSVTTTENVTDPTKFTVGDEHMSDYNACVNGVEGLFTFLLDGRSAWTVTKENNYDWLNFTGELEVDWQVDNFTLGFTDAEGTDSFTLDGLMTHNYTGTDLAVTQTITSDAIEIKDNIDGTIMRQTEVAAVYQISKADGLYSSDADYKLAITSTDINVDLTIVTDPAFTGNEDMPPSSGKMTITDSAGAVIIVEALNESQVKISLDENGDGMPEEERVLSWSELDA